MVILPTKAGIHFATSWDASGEHLLPKYNTDQKGLEIAFAYDRPDKFFDTCHTHCRCFHEIHRASGRCAAAGTFGCLPCLPCAALPAEWRTPAGHREGLASRALALSQAHTQTPTLQLPTLQLKEEGRRDQVALIRAYVPGWFMYSQYGCESGSEQWAPRVDPCDWAVLYMHTICTTHPSHKAHVLKAIGFWFMDDTDGGEGSEGGSCPPQPGAASGVPSCRPRQWRLPQTEVAHYSCPSFQLGLMHGGEPLASAALREGVEGEEALALFSQSSDSHCNKV
jgi:hypothetical protein